LMIRRSTNSDAIDVQISLSHIRLLVAFLAGVCVCMTIIYFRTKNDDITTWGEWEEAHPYTYDIISYSKDELANFQKKYDRAAACVRDEAHPNGCAYATLVAGNEFIELALVLAESLRESNSPYPLIALTTDKTSENGIELLTKAGLVVHRLSDVAIPGHVQPWREYWRSTYVKLKMWELWQYERIVFIDADSIVMGNMDDLFRVHGEYLAATDRHLCKHELEPGMTGMVSVMWPDLNTANDIMKFFNNSGYGFSRGDQAVTENFFEMHKTMKLLNETWATFVFRCQCEDFPFVSDGSKNSPKSVHFTGWFRPHVTVNGVSVPLGLSHKARECALPYYRHWEEMWKKVMKRVGMNVEEFMKENIRHIRG